MNMEIRISSPIILILIGLGFLLANLDIIAMSPWEAFVSFWPALLIFYGAYLLVKVAAKSLRHRYLSTSGLLWSAILIILGLYLLAPRVGWDVTPLSWGIVWPTALIVIGLIKILQDRYGLFSTSVHAGPYKTSFVGEVHRGGSSWVLDDMRLRHGVGEVHLDLTQAIIPDREVNIDIGGMVGEVTIYVPSDLPIKAFCESNIGEITILDLHRDGLGNTLTWISPDYETSTRKVNITVQWKIGEIKIRRIG